MKKLIALLLALVMVVGLVACGGAAEPPTAEVQPTEAEPQPTAEKEEAPVEDADPYAEFAGQTVRFYTYPAGGRDQAAYDEFCAEFEKISGIDVECTVIPWGADGMAKLTAAYMSDEAPDVVFVTAETAYDLISNGYLADLTQFLPAETFDDNLYSEATKINGVQYCLPRNVSFDARGIWYNLDLLKAAGVDTENLPTTRDEFIDVALKVKEAGVCEYPVMMSLYGQAENTLSSLIGNIWSGGGDLVDENGKVIFDSAENTATLQWIDDLVHKYGVLSEDCIAMNTDLCGTSFGEGNIAIYFGTTGFPKVISEYLEDDQYAFTMGVAAEGHELKSFNPIDMLGMNPNSEAPGAAAAFLNWMVTLDGRELYRTGLPNPDSVLPTNRSQEGLWTYVPTHPSINAYMDDLATVGRALPVAKGVQAMLDGMVAEVQLMILGDQTVEETMANIHANCLAAQED